MSTDRTVRVDVTATDIEHGEAGSCLLCPVARALARVFPGVLVEVAPLHLRINGQRVAASDEVVGFIGVFDDPRLPAPAPFSFELRWVGADERWVAA